MLGMDTWPCMTWARVSMCALQNVLVSVRTRSCLSAWRLHLARSLTRIELSMLRSHGTRRRDDGKVNMGRPRRLTGGCARVSRGFRVQFSVFHGTCIYLHAQGHPHVQEGAFTWTCYGLRCVSSAFRTPATTMPPRAPFASPPDTCSRVARPSRSLARPIWYGGL